MSFQKPHSPSPLHVQSIRMFCQFYLKYTLGLFLSIITSTLSFFLLDYGSNFLIGPLLLLWFYLINFSYTSQKASKSAYLIISLLLQQSLTSHCPKINLKLLHVAYTQFGSRFVPPILFFQGSFLSQGQKGPFFTSLIAPCFCLQALNMLFPVWNIANLHSPDTDSSFRPQI